MSNTPPDTPLDQAALDQLFNAARTHVTWADRPIPEPLLHQVWALTAMPPTSANCCPVRIVFVTSEAGRATLLEAVADGNKKQTEGAPCTAVIGMDMEFYEKLPQLYPATDARAWFVGNDDLIEATAWRNGSLQGGYLMLAARALGLSVGPMSGFDEDKINEAFFAGTTVKANFLCNLGYGTFDKVYPRAPRFAFDEACRIA